MNKIKKKIEKQKKEEQNPFLNLCLQYLYKEMYNHKFKTLKQKVIRTTIFLFIIGISTNFYIYGESAFFCTRIPIL
ncbi:hypothetical protein ACE3MZ_07355 [Paenibacillus sp. WLX1005]|uniref:hypothetical protein n=1 Tax=Paenibacillus sp. WLX1005 TaxID=3243766 RepID=UPI0039843BBA